jgi:hypothetical protein
MHVYPAPNLLKHMAIDPKLRVRCPVCGDLFRLLDGKTVQGVNNGEPTTGFFCTFTCLLRIVPPTAIGNA